MFTYEDLCLLPEDRLRHEILDGEHVVTPSPAQKHQYLLGRLYFEFAKHLETHRAGVAFLSPFDVVFSQINVLVPDLLYISNERWDVLTEKNVQGAPDLAVEILSPSTRRRDLGKKREIYERFGVLAYWIVDPEDDSVRVMLQHEGALREVPVFQATAGETLTTPLLPGLEISFAQLFRPLRD
jgi:Uma2 family endonuclease